MIIRKVQLILHRYTLQVHIVLQTLLIQLQMRLPMEMHLLVLVMGQRKIGGLNLLLQRMA